MRDTLIAALIALAALAGCGSAAPPEKLSGPLRFERGGGLTGRLDALTIRPDGSGTLRTYRGESSLDLTRAELDAVAGELAGFADAPEESRARPPVPDTYTYRVTYEGRTVAADQTVMPDEVSGLMARLGALVDAHLAP